MAVKRHFVRLWLLLVLGGLSAISEPSRAAANAPAPAAASSEPGWLRRTLSRYFGGGAPAGAELGGRALEIVDRYAAFAGQPIEVVIVSQVGKFDTNWDRGQGTAQRLFAAAAKPLQSYTRDATIRQYLLFQAGQTVDPFRIADSERLLRGLDFIEDVRISVVPLQGGSGAVAVVVETRDRWPFGAAGVAKDVGRYEASLFHSNVAGIGLRFENRLIYRDDRAPNLGYRGALRLANFRGTFISSALSFEDSYTRNHIGIAVARELAHPAIKWVGGGSWRRTRERDAGPDPDQAEVTDVWLGDVIPLRASLRGRQTARPVLVPALRFARRVQLDRPQVGPNLLRQYHSYRDYLVGLTYQRFKYYKTSYLFEMGETEDLPAGLVVQLAGGYQDGEFHDRAQANFQSSYFATRNRGDVAFARFNLGGFFRDRRFEDGSLIASAGYYTPLMGRGRWHSRFYTNLAYYHALERDTQSALTLGDASGLRGMDNDSVAGNRRLVGNLEYRVFPPWVLWGFRFMVSGFIDVGVIGPEGKPLLDNKAYVSSGLALRIRNLDLVLPPLQLRVAFRNSIDDKGVLVGLRVGGTDSPQWVVPGAKPGSFAFR